MDDPVTRYRAVHEDLEALFARFSDQDVIAPGNIGTWALRDVMAHLAAWDIWARRAIEVRLTADDLPAEMNEEARNPDPFNARAAEAWKGYTAAEARAAFSQAFADLEYFIQTTPHDQLSRQIVRPNGKTSSPVSTLVALARHSSEHCAELGRLLNP